MPKTICITGAGSGIGRRTAFALAERGHRVIATTHTEAEADDVLEEARAEGLALESFKLDITDERDYARVLGRALDVLINNAGIGESGSLAEVPLERVRRNFEVNVFSTIALTQAVLAGMMARRQGTIVTVSSLAGRAPMPFLNPYSMTKHALSAGMAALRKEIALVAPQVHICLIEPGAYATGFNEEMMGTKYSWMAEGSYFTPVRAKLEAQDARFARFQSKNIESIVRQVVRAAEAKKPKLRYSAPFIQAFGIRLLRLFGA